MSKLSRNHKLFRWLTIITSAWLCITISSQAEATVYKNLASLEVSIATN